MFPDLSSFQALQTRIRELEIRLGERRAEPFPEPERASAPEGTKPASFASYLESASIQNKEDWVEEISTQRGVDPLITKAIIRAESNGSPKALSHKGAMGLMQLMPKTAESLGVLDPFDPVENVQGGVSYLSSLLSQFGGDRKLALAAYNAGPNAVKKYGGIPPYPETQNYVKKVESYYKDSLSNSKNSLR